MSPTLRRNVITLSIFVGLIVAWKWPLIEALLRPTLIESGVATTVSEEPTPDPGFTYPRLGITAPVTVSPLTSPLEYRDWNEIRAALREGVSLSYQQDEFAESQLAFVTGHSSDVTNHPYSSVFASLGQATIGDEFSLVLGSTTYRYQVTDQRTLDPRNTKTFEQLAPESGQRVVLVTCWPPLTTKSRLVVVGERISQ